MKIIPLGVLGLFTVMATPALAQTPKAGSAQGDKAGQPAAVTVVPPSDATPYDGPLTRLAEIVGALHYLRPLCGAKGEDWRSDMQKILDSDAANEPARKARLTAAFNRGYRSFASVHTACSDTAIKVEARYRAEAATLVAEITSRYGN